MAASNTLAVRPGAVGLAIPYGLRRTLPLVGVSAAALAWAACFGSLAVTRHLAGGSHAEDLGWTDQVLNNFLRGQFFRMSIYQGAFWNTELNVQVLHRPDSLLAFHVEPMLLLLVPLYALGGTVTSLLVLQALVFAAGAIPAYRIGARFSRSARVGVAVALAYLVSPLGQWAVLSDFHTSTLAAPLLLLTADVLLEGRRAWAVLGVAALAASAREDVAPAVALLAFLPLLGLTTPRRRTLGIALMVGAVAWTILCALVIQAYSGGGSPFAVRYAALPEAGPFALLVRPIVVEYGKTLLLSGGWLALFAPLAVLPAIPSLLLNVLSSSDWMASGKAHYSAPVLPFVVLGAAAALGRLGAHRSMLHGAAIALVASSVAAYWSAGAGPLAANYAPATVTQHAVHAAAIADGLPMQASVSATSSLVPHLTRRAHVYEFPAVLDADYIFLDVQASPAPTSAGDVFLRVASLLDQGGWNVDLAEDGLLLLHRVDGAPPTDVRSLGAALFPTHASNLPPSSALKLVDAQLVPPPDGAIDVDGPRWILHTTWQTPHTLQAGQLHVALDLGTAGVRDVWDLAPVWWDTPQAWPPDSTVTIDVPDVPRSQFRSWRAALQ